MLRGIAPPGKDCETPINTLVQTGQKYRVNGTPTLIFADGSVVPGMITAEVIEKKLNAAAPK
jgi:thiol:disulfide interchange protein DsbC